MVFEFHESLFQGDLLVVDRPAVQRLNDAVVASAACELLVSSPEPVELFHICECDVLHFLHHNERDALGAGWLRERALIVEERSVHPVYVLHQGGFEGLGGGCVCRQHSRRVIQLQGL